MHILSNGQLLKTKIVATVGKERSGPEAGRKDQLFDPEGSAVINTLSFDELLSWLILKGADVIRLNMSFASEQEPYGAVERRILEWITANKDGLAKNVAVLGDLPGPKIRLRVAQSYCLSGGETFLLDFIHRNFTGEGKGAAVLVNNQPFSEIATVNDFPRIEEYVADARRQQQEVIISVGDGKVILKGLSAGEGIVTCSVVKGGDILNKQGVTIKNAPVQVPPFSEQDQRALDHLLDNGAEVVSYIGVSFVNGPEDILKVKRHIEKRLESRYHGKARRYSPAIVAKIETRQAWENLDKILDVSDCVMVARGDLGLQLDPQHVPAIQKEIIRRCNLRGKAVITATQMLDSMETNIEPTRAEASDVFNAIQDGTDAVMLSGETSKGRYPAQAVEMMVQIAEQAEKFYEKRYSGRAYKAHLQDVLSESETKSRRTTRRLEEAKANWANQATMANITSEEEEEYLWRGKLYADKIERSQKQTTTDRISESACLLSEGEDYKAIIAPTTSGRTARMIARFRPNVPIIGVAHDEANARKLILSFGVYPLCIGEGQSSIEEVFSAACDAAVKKGYIPWRPEFQLLKKGDMVISTSGTPLRKIGTTNLIQIRKV